MSVVRILVISWWCVLLMAASTARTQAQSAATTWLENGQPTELAIEAVQFLQSAREDGLDPDDYLASELLAELKQLQASTAFDPVAATDFTARLSAAMTQYLNDLALGRVTAREVYSDFDGALARDYDAQLEWRSAMSEGNLAGAVARARPSFPLYPSLREALAQYRKLAGHAAWATELPMPDNRKLETGDAYVALPELRERLILLGDLKGDAPVSATYDKTLAMGIQAFQQRHGLNEDGIVGAKTLAALNVSPSQRAEQIVLSMERLRWTPLRQGDRLIAVNLPGFMLYAYEIDDSGEVTVDVEMKVVVGQSLNHRTPVFDEDMLFIEFSPYWNIPPSIARAETLPALRKDPNYLQQQQMEFVDGSGQISTAVTPAAMQAVLDGQLRIRQRPGSHNALGSIKFIFPNNQNIFLHHTPSTHLFGRDRRDLSHGCIRVERPLALASFVLAKDPQWPVDRIEEAMQANQSKTIRLKEPIPVLIGYSTVLARGKKVFFYPDLYGHDAILIKALEQYRGLQ